ncbi:galectin-4 [Motacilla alba alba]|uniref:galectin-4 n=1 Tax=Motacilla alba alba TaxID=1094192 RepID=UPI0018D4F87D|nr:galectin-4 [Motacilla alba alba]
MAAVPRVQTWRPRRPGRFHGNGGSSGLVAARSDPEMSPGVSPMLLGPRERHGLRPTSGVHPCPVSVHSGLGTLLWEPRDGPGTPGGEGTSAPSMDQLTQYGPGNPDAPQVAPIYPDCNLPVMGQPPTLHPPVPFIATIPGGLVPKKTVVIKGFVPHHANRFHINLRAGPGGDVVLHLNPRMDEGDAVVRNSLLGGSWGHEERDISCCSPFQRGRYFDLSIRCGNHRFKVFAEGQPLFDFHHRVPAGPHVDVLEIEGDVVLSYVHF